jgi:hypothetical protein
MFEQWSMKGTPGQQADVKHGEHSNNGGALWLIYVALHFRASRPVLINS